MVGVKGRPCHYVKDIVCPGRECGKCATWHEFEVRYLQAKARA
jgi:hypothetical protein